MKTKYLAILILALAELTLTDINQWVTDHLSLNRLVATLAGPTISGGDRNGLNPR